MQYAPALWLDASDQSTMYQERTGASATTLVSSDADPVGTWRDKSGNARHVTAPSDAARPTYKVGIQNGKSSVRNDGVDDSMETAEASWFSTQQNITVFAVVRPELAAAADTVTMFRTVHLTDSAAGKSYSLISGATSGVYAGEKISPIFGDWGPAVRTGVSNYSRSANETQVLSLTAGTTGIKMWSNSSELTIDKLNAFTPSTSSGPSVTSMTSPKFAVVTAINISKYTDLLELLIYPSILSTSQRQQVERYLGNKWGITLS